MPSLERENEHARRLRKQTVNFYRHRILSAFRREGGTHPRLCVSDGANDKPMAYRRLESMAGPDRQTNYDVLGERVVDLCVNDSRQVVDMNACVWQPSTFMNNVGL